MIFRIIALTAALAAMFAAMACGGGSNANVAPSKSSNQANAVIHTNTNVVVNSAGSTSNNNGYSVTYEDANGNPVKAPANVAKKPTPNGTPPKGANYLCRDGTYSMGNQDSTACSGHNGVLKPLSNTPPQ